jgi:hypothetical protein
MPPVSIGARHRCTGLALCAAIVSTSQVALAAGHPRGRPGQRRTATRRATPAHSTFGQILRMVPEGSLGKLLRRTQGRVAVTVKAGDHDVGALGSVRVFDDRREPGTQAYIEMADGEAFVEFLPPVETRHGTLLAVSAALTEDGRSIDPRFVIRRGNVTVHLPWLDIPVDRLTSPGRGGSGGLGLLTQVALDLAHTAKGQEGKVTGHVDLDDGEVIGAKVALEATLGAEAVRTGAREMSARMPALARLFARPEGDLARTLRRTRGRVDAKLEAGDYDFGSFIGPVRVNEHRLGEGTDASIDLSAGTATVTFDPPVEVLGVEVHGMTATLAKDGRSVAPRFLIGNATKPLRVPWFHIPVDRLLELGRGQPRDLGLLTRVAVDLAYQTTGQRGRVVGHVSLDDGELTGAKLELDMALGAEAKAPKKRPI